MASLRLEGAQSRREDPEKAVDDVDWGRRKQGRGRKGMRLFAEAVVFMTARENEEDEEIGGCGGGEWDEEE